MKKCLEICCYTVESAIIAEKAGADRIELCENYTEGGTTPSYGSIKTAIDKLNIPVNIIIRPRGGDFLYSDTEFEIIKQDVKTVKQLGANGVVIGFLNSDGSLDIEKTKEIIELAKPMEVTFHRAFDRCKEPFMALEQLINIGVDCILTSGQEQTAYEGANLISNLIEKANSRIIIMPGSGVNDRNISKLIAKTKAFQFHSSAKTFIQTKMNYSNKTIPMGSNLVDENRIVSVDFDMVKVMKQFLL
jgi:copper homeostasis protein